METEHTAAVVAVLAAIGRIEAAVAETVVAVVGVAFGPEGTRPAQGADQKGSLLELV